MSAILSADDLNDFISPSVACIKPVETLPHQTVTSDSANSFEVTTEDAAAVAAAAAAPAQISLTDCLACSGCVTSAEAVLVSLQSYQEVLSTLDAYAEIPLPKTQQSNEHVWKQLGDTDGKIFVASVSPQARASIAATYGVSDKVAGHLIEQLLSGPEGLRSGGAHGSGFAWVLDTNKFRAVALEAAVDELRDVTSLSQARGDFATLASRPAKPILTSACPGWVCYAEKSQPHVLPHLSKVKSPQALAGTLVKSVLAKKYGISSDKIWHMAVMPCFDKKLEASREELTDLAWGAQTEDMSSRARRDVDLVITARELLSLAEARGISLPRLPPRSVPQDHRTPFPDQRIHDYLFSRTRRKGVVRNAGSSGGYLWHMLKSVQAQHSGSRIVVQRGRNSDVIEYTVTQASDKDGQDAVVLLRAARYYGFRNIQNLVRRLKPAKTSRLLTLSHRSAEDRRRPALPSRASSVADKAESYDHVEVMACPGGCTNGGGQIRLDDARRLRAADGDGQMSSAGLAVKEAQREWLAQVDEAYYSAESGDSGDDEADTNEIDDDDYDVDGIPRSRVRDLVKYWAACTGVDDERLLRTTYRKVTSDVGKKGSDVERVAGLASSIGGGW